MSVFSPVKLSQPLKQEIRALADALHVKVAAVPGQEEPDLGSSEPLRLSPQVPIKSHLCRSRSEEEGKKLRIRQVCSNRSPWDERYPPNWIEETDDAGREEKLQQEQIERERDFPDRLRERERLPIFEAKSRVLSAIGRSRVTLVAADTGSGKSTQVPQFILDEAIAEGRGRDVHVVCTQPRRLAAVSLASRVAWERGERSDGAGSTGHVVRWEEKPPRPWGSIVFCTVGSLLPRVSRLGASHIIVDEAHTRDIHTDLLLTVLLELLRYSKDLKVIVMSATLDVSKWQGHFQNFDCELVRAGGRPYEVQRYFLEDIVQALRWQPDGGQQQDLPGVWCDLDCNRGFMDPEGRYSPATVQTVRSLPESVVPFQLIAAVLKWIDGREKAGGVLIFLPGWHEIASCMSRLQRDPSLRHWEFVPLHSTVPPNEQYRAFHPASAGSRKAVLSTDIAETSITIPDIICVVDSGLARVKRHTNLEVVWASQANLLQRAGRAGRVQQGLCVHLFTRSRFSYLDPEPTPEMRRVPLDEALLSVCDLGLDDCTESITEEDKEAYGPCVYVMTFLKQAPDPPLPKDVWNAFKELQHVGALDRAGFLTHLGALLVRLPMSPGLGSAFYFASILGFPEAASQVAAALDGREPFSRRQNEDAPSSAMNFAMGTDGQKKWSDVFAMAKALGDFEMHSKGQASRLCREKGLIFPVMQQLCSARQQLQRVSWDLCRACRYWPDDQPNVWSDTWEDDGSEPSGGEASAGCDTDSVFPKDNLEESWPVMQTMLALAYSWNIGKLEGGRRVNAGWSKASRLAKTSVLVDEEPPCDLLTYVELTNSGGRILRGGTVVTPQQLVLCGSRDGPFWQNDMVLLENWLEIEADYESAALLAALRTCNSLVLQKAAELSLQDFKGQWIEWDSHRQSLLELIQKWRRCVVQVACLPLPEKISVWDMDFSRVATPRTPHVVEPPPDLLDLQPVAPLPSRPFTVNRWTHHRAEAARTPVPLNPWQSPPQETQSAWQCAGAQPSLNFSTNPQAHQLSMPPWQSPPQETQSAWQCAGAQPSPRFSTNPQAHQLSMPPWQSPQQEIQSAWKCVGAQPSLSFSTNPQAHQLSTPSQQWQSPSQETPSAWAAAQPSPNFNPQAQQLSTPSQQWQSPSQETPSAWAAAQPGPNFNPQVHQLPAPSQQWQSPSQETPSAWAAAQPSPNFNPQAQQTSMAPPRPPCAATPNRTSTLPQQQFQVQENPYWSNNW